MFATAPLPEGLPPACLWLQMSGDYFHALSGKVSVGGRGGSPLKTNCGNLILIVPNRLLYPQSKVIIKQHKQWSSGKVYFLCYVFEVTFQYKKFLKI